MIIEKDKYAYLLFETIKHDHLYMTQTISVGIGKGGFVDGIHVWI